MKNLSLKENEFNGGKKNFMGALFLLLMETNVNWVILYDEVDYLMFDSLEKHECSTD